MKKFTKIMIGAGLTVAALGAAAAPATAATTTESTSSIGTTATEKMWVGPWVIYTGETSQSNKYGYQSDANGNFKYEFNKPGVSIGFPLVGQSGKAHILSGAFAGKCLGPGAPTSSGSASLNVTGVDCATAPTMELNAKGQIRSAALGGLYLSDQTWSPGNGNSPSVWWDLLVMKGFAEQDVQVGVVPVDVTGPAAGSTVDTKNPTFSGTGDEGATVVVKDENGQELCRTTVVGGVWSCVSAVDLPDGPHKAVADQTATDGSTSSDSVDFIVADGAGGPVMDPMIAGGAGLVLLAAAGAVIAVKRRQSAPAAL